MATEISPALHEIIVAVSRKAVDERLAETAIVRQDLNEVKAALRDLAAAQARTEERVEQLAQAQARTEERVGRLEAVVERLAEAQARTEERVGRLEAAVERLAEAQARTEERLVRLEAVVERLAEAQARTEERVRRLEATVERLVEAQARTEERLVRLEAVVERLAEAQVRTEETVAGMQITLGDLKGRQLEHDYRDRAYAYFGRLLRHVQVVSLQEIEGDLERHLSDQEMDDLLPLDLLVRGRPRHQPDAPEVWLAVEISVVVDRHDVERAQRRAAALRGAGLRAIPTVAGEQVTTGAEEIARAKHVLLLQDGRALFWEETLAEALAARPQ